MLAVIEDYVISSVLHVLKSIGCWFKVTIVVEMHIWYDYLIIACSRVVHLMLCLKVLVPLLVPLDNDSCMIPYVGYWYVRRRYNQLDLLSFSSIVQFNQDRL